MAKATLSFVCQNCGAAYGRWQGKCESCGEWNTLAEEDAKLRGLGEFFGTRQHGLGDLRFGDLLRDRELLETARRDAIELVGDDARLLKPEHVLLRQAVIEKYGKTLDLASIG